MDLKVCDSGKGHGHLHSQNHDQILGKHIFRLILWSNWNIMCLFNESYDFVHLIESVSSHVKSFDAYFNKSSFEGAEMALMAAVKYGISTPLYEQLCP